METIPQAVFVLVGLVVIGLAVAAASVNYYILVTPAGPRIGGVLNSRRAALKAFFRDDLPGVRYALVVGHRHPRGRLRLVALGLTRGQRQRLRNFLLVG